jgi:hypothetical protein
MTSNCGDEEWLFFLTKKRRLLGQLWNDFALGSRPFRSAHRGHVTSNWGDEVSLFFLTKKDYFRGHYWMTLHQDQGHAGQMTGVTWLLTVGRRDHYFSWPKKDDFWGNY